VNLNLLLRGYSWFKWIIPWAQQKHAFFGAGVFKVSSGGFQQFYFV
jgi:hypothetical protein